MEDLPKDQWRCLKHPDRQAVARLKGKPPLLEVDYFCDECLEDLRQHLRKSGFVMDDTGLVRKIQ